MLADLVPVGLGGLLLVARRTAIPPPGKLLGARAAAVVLEVGLAHRPSLRPVGHVLVPVVTAGDPVDIEHNSLVDLQRPDGLAVVADGHVVAGAFDDDQSADEVGDGGHGLESVARC